MKRVKVGVIGCGNISAAYLKAAKTFAMLDIVALSDQNPEASAARPAELDNRWLRVRAADLTSRRPQVNVNVPMTWANARLRIGRSFVPELDQIDWNRVLNSPPGSGPIRLLEVEDMDDNQRIEISVE